MTDAKLANSDIYFSGNSFFPDDMWAEIFQHLTSEEIIKLKQTTPNMAKVMASDQIADAVLLPLLNRLSKLDADISTVNIKNKNILAAVLEGINRINAKQIEEGKYLIKYRPQTENSLNDHLNPTTNIDLLEERSDLLDRINSELILSKIGDGSSTILNLFSLNITRFPQSLMEKKELLDINYWQKLQKLSFYRNRLTTLPPLNTLVNLTSLDCSSNMLASLPSLDALQALKELGCGRNQLTSLPSLNKLVNLQKLYCNDNQLTSLQVLDDLIDLEELNCSNNQLSALPSLDTLIDLNVLNCSNNQLSLLPALDTLVRLFTLDCSYNQLTTLPRYLQDRGFKLSHQNPPSAPTLIIPNFNQAKKNSKISDDVTQSELIKQKLN